MKNKIVFLCHIYPIYFTIKKQYFINTRLVLLNFMSIKQVKNVKNMKKITFTFFLSFFFSIPLHIFFSIPIPPCIFFFQSPHIFYVTCWYLKWNSQKKQLFHVTFIFFPGTAPALLHTLYIDQFMVKLQPIPWVFPYWTFTSRFQVVIFPIHFYCNT